MVEQFYFYRIIHVFSIPPGYKYQIITMPQINRERFIRVGFFGEIMFDIELVLTDFEVYQYLYQFFIKKKILNPKIQFIFFIMILYKNYLSKYRQTIIIK